MSSPSLLHSASTSFVEREKVDSPRTGENHKTLSRLRQKQNQPGRGDGDVMVVGQEPSLRLSIECSSMICQVVGTLVMMQLGEG